MSAGPQPFRWSGEAMIPLRIRSADRAFVIVARNIGWSRNGGARSPRTTTNSRGFGGVAQSARGRGGPLSVPGSICASALVQAGYYTETIVDAGSNAVALRGRVHASEGRRVRHRRRARRHRGRARRQEPVASRHDAEGISRESKTAIMEIIAQLIGVDPADLWKAEAA